MLSLLRGIGLPPALVGAARGVLEAVIIGALGAAAVELSVADWGQFAVASPFVFAAIRFLEGVADHIDPVKSRVPPG